MNISGLIKRITPLCLKISGKLPQCPWSSVMYTLNPKHLPIKIDAIETDGDFKKLLSIISTTFGFHAAPESMRICGMNTYQLLGIAQ